MSFQESFIHETVQNAREEALQCLAELIQTPSITEQEVPVSKVFCKWIEKAGIEPKIHGISEEHPNVFGEWKGNTPGKRFIFNGHMDTFPADPAAPTLFGPFSGVIDKGYIYGRGACDMKGGDAAAIMAVTLLKRMGFEPKGSVLLSFMCDEEIGGRYGSKWLTKQELLNGDFGLCMEPTNGKILVGHSGIYRVWITYHSVAVNSARNHPTKNALEKSVIAINRLYQYREEVRERKDPNYDCASFSITTLHAGGATNVHASESKFSIDYRLIPGETQEQIDQELKGILDELKAADPEMDYTITPISDRPVLAVPEDSDIVKACQEAYRETTGKEPVLFVRHGGSDAATIQAHNGILMPNWGAAEVEEGATPNEKLRISDYLDSIEYYMRTVIKMLG